MQLTDILTDTERRIGQMLITGQTGVFTPVLYSNAKHAESIIAKHVQ